MTISDAAWTRYIEQLRAVNERAAALVTEYIETHDVGTPARRAALIDYAYAVATKYGEGAAALACEMYDATALASHVTLPAAEPAPTATYQEVARTVQGVQKQSLLPQTTGNAVGRLVKRTGVDTTMQNALRDGAEWAWIPRGDTCAFCIMLASNGWQRASKKAIKGGHAEHIHANCDCTYAVRYDRSTTVDGYDPDKYFEMYANADGDTWQEKVNSMRREQYAADPEHYRAQKRAEYAERKERSSIMRARVENGEYSLTLPRQKYAEHVEGTPQYINTTRGRNGVSPSRLSVTFDEAQDLITRYSGTGTPKTARDGTVLDIEFVTADKVIGQYFDWGRREWVDTKRFGIYHGKNGSHIVPVKFMEDEDG